MCDWIDSKLDAHHKSFSEVQTIRNGADELYEHLWKEVVALSQYAATKGMRTFTNGTAYERVVAMSLMPTTDQQVTTPRKLKLALPEDRRKIIASWDSEKIEFALGVYPDGVLVIKRGEAPVSPKEAAKLIMEPFLFEGKSPYRADL